MKGSFINNLHKAFVVSIMLICTMAAISFIALKESNERAKIVQHTQVVIKELEQLISRMKDAETGVRGYIITSDPMTLEPYNGAYPQTLKIYNHLKQLTQDNPEQKRTLPLLRKSIDEKYRFLKFEVDVKRTGKPFDPNLVKEGKRIMDEARLLVNEMKNRELALLEKRSEAWQIYSKITPFLIIFLTLIAAATSYYFCTWLKRTYLSKAKLRQQLQRKNIETNKRIKIIENIADKIAAGDYHIRLEEDESDVLGNLAISLNRMALSLEYSFNEIKALMTKKDDFIGIAAHELKTPLTSIKAYLQFIGRSRLENNDAAKVYPFITKANNQVNRLTEIIKDLLDVARINENQLGLKITTFSIREAILEASEELFNSIRTHELILEGEPDVLVEADRFRIEQVLINLISNAVKYSPNAKKIICEVTPEGSLVRVAITDFGIGIPPENLQFVFQRYFRVEVTSQNYSGMGLGLYISKGIIERHGGKMGVASKEGEGSTFWFTIPVKHKES